jgi:membrane protein
VEGTAGSLGSRAKQLPARIREHNTTLVAAGVAFYGFLAFVPALIAFISIYGLAADPSDVKRQVNDVASALPHEVQRFLVFQLDSIIKANTSAVSITLVVAIAVALWSASGGIAALVTGIHVALERDEPKSFVTKRAKALALTFGAILFLGMVVFLIAALPPLASGAGDAGRLGLQILRWPILAVVMVFGLGLLYRFSTPGPSSGWLGIVTAGSVVATIGWLIVSALFAVYTANFASYSKTYGALASIVVLLLWLWLSSLLILVGAEFDGANAAPE